MPTNARFRSRTVSAQSSLFPRSYNGSLVDSIFQGMAFRITMNQSEITITSTRKRVIFFSSRQKREIVSSLVHNILKSWWKPVKQKSILYLWLLAIHTSPPKSGLNVVSVTSFLLTRKTRYWTRQSWCSLKHFIVWCSQAARKYARLLKKLNSQLRRRFHKKKPTNFWLTTIMIVKMKAGNMLV